jgi:hypothetical protein
MPDCSPYLIACYLVVQQTNAATGPESMKFACLCTLISLLPLLGTVNRLGTWEKLEEINYEATATTTWIVSAVVFIVTSLVLSLKFVSLKR